MNGLSEATADAVRHFWTVRRVQGGRPSATASGDAGRQAVTGGAQLGGFEQLIETALTGAGVQDTTIITRRPDKILPGFFRPTKQWDLLVVDDRRLVASIELKSQVGPSFGNNFNNRVEEAIGNAKDHLAAYREGAYGSSPRPWLGYVMLLEETEASVEPVAVNEPQFDVFPEFHGASYAKRYELFCRKLVREQLYDAAWFILSDAVSGADGGFRETSSELSGKIFISSLVGRASAFKTNP